MWLVRRAQRVTTFMALDARARTWGALLSAGDSHDRQLTCWREQAISVLLLLLLPPCTGERDSAAALLFRVRRGSPAALCCHCCCCCCCRSTTTTTRFAYARCNCVLESRNRLAGRAYARQSIIGRHCKQKTTTSCVRLIRLLVRVVGCERALDSDAQTKVAVAHNKRRGGRAEAGKTASERASEQQTTQRHNKRLLKHTASRENLTQTQLQMILQLHSKTTKQSS